MTPKIKLFIILLFAFIISSFAQSNFNLKSNLKIENYSYGELVLKVVPFGLGKEINIGKILKDGTIQFNWPKIDLKTIESSSVFMQNIKSSLLGMSYCEDDQIEKNTKECQVVDTQYIYLYQNNKQVGVLFPATEKEIINNEPANIYSQLVKGSSLTWFYSDGTCNFKAECSEKMEWEGKYNFVAKKSYDIQLKKGWNLVEQELLEIEEFKDELGTGYMEKKVSKKSIGDIPKNIKWHIKVFGRIN